MASFMTKFGSAMLNRTGKSRFISNGTSPTYKAAAATSVADGVHAQPRASQPVGQWAPVAVLMGFIGVAGCMALHSGIQELGRSPTVKVTKKNRESITEVFDPDSFVGTTNRYVHKSFFRKIAKIQEPKSTFSEYPDPFTRSREVVSLKSAGVR